MARFRMSPDEARTDAGEYCQELEAMARARGTDTNGTPLAAISEDEPAWRGSSWDTGEGP